MGHKKDKYLVPFLIFFALALGLFIGRMAFMYSNDLPLVYKRSKSEKILKLIDLINSQYVDKVNTDSVVDQLITEMLTELDPHSKYFDRKTYKQVREHVYNEYYGIGVVFNNMLDTPVIVREFKESPARESGLIIGDMLLKANNVPLVGLSIDSIVDLIKGEQKTSVNLTVLRKYRNDTFKVSVERKQIHVPTVFGYFIDSLDFGYIKIDHFGVNTYDEFSVYVDSFLQRNIRGLILDLQGNTGGILGPTVQILEEFFPKGTLLCYMKGRNIIKHKCYSQKKGRLIDIPLAVLINSNTASASEIVAGALQDNDRAVIIGTRSFGKGLIQSEFHFSDGSVVRLTTSRYFTPSGRCLQKPYSDYMSDYLLLRDTVLLDTTKKYKTLHGRTVYGGGGVFPDIVVKDTLDDMNFTASLLEVRLLTKYGPLLQNFDSPKDIEVFTDTVLHYHLPGNIKFVLDYNLIHSVFGDVPALKFYNAHSKVFHEAVDVLKSERYKDILNLEQDEH